MKPQTQRTDITPKENQEPSGKLSIQRKNVTSVTSCTLAVACLPSELPFIFREILWSIQCCEAKYQNKLSPDITHIQPLWSGAWHQSMTQSSHLLDISRYELHCFPFCSHCVPTSWVHIATLSCSPGRGNTTLECNLHVCQSWYSGKDWYQSYSNWEDVWVSRPSSA